MRQTEVVVKPAKGIVRPLPAIPVMPRAVWVLLSVLALGLLAISLYLAPTIATLALVVLGLGVPLLWLVWIHPELGLLTLVFFTSSLIRPDTVDLRLPVGGLDLRDLMLLGMLGILILQGLTRKKLAVPWWPVSRPLLVFLGFAIFSALYALFYQGVESNWALGELRALIYYAVFFVTVWAIARPKQLVILLAGLFFLADLTAGVVILQQFFGKENRLLGAMSGGAWRVWQVGDPSIAFGAVRIVPPGHILIFVMTIIAFCLIVLVRHNLFLRVVCALEFLFLNTGLLFTYTRAQWVASVIALGVVFVLISPSGKRQLLQSLLIGLLLLALVYVFFGAELSKIWDHVPFVQILASRVLSFLTPRQTLQTFSLEWRRFETGEALRSISQHPLLGVGLGNSYRDVTLLQGEASGGYFRFTRYVHSSYLSIAVKMGLPGLIAFLWFCSAFLANGLRTYTDMPDRQLKSVVLAVLTSFVGLLAWSIYHSHFVEVESTTVVGLMVGLIGSIRHITRV